LYSRINYMYRLTPKWIFILISCLGLLVIAVVIFYYSKTPYHAQMQRQSRHVAIGVWTEGLFDANNQKLHPEKLLQFEQMIHKKVSIAHYYIGWEALSNSQLISQFDILRSHGWEPMLNVNPYYFSQCPATKLPLYKAIAAGKCDDFLHRAGANLHKVKQPFYLLFAWEMNNQQNEWSVPYTGSSSDDFIAAWRHIYTIFKQEKATKVIWVFCPNVPDNASVPYKKLYPGNKFVDWIGLDGYNWGTSQSWSQWASFAGVFTSSYQHLTNIAPNKPLMIAEVNTTDQGGDKAAWYTDMLTQQIPYKFHKVNAVVIFNEDRSNQEHVNWDVDINPESLHAFILGVHTKFY